MGSKGSKHADVDVEQTEGPGGNSTMARAIAKGRVYVIISYPHSVIGYEGVAFNDSQFRELLMALQEQLADFEVIVDAGKVDRFCEFVTCHNSNDPNKLVSKPRVLVEVFYTGVYAGIEKKKIQSTVQEMLDPQSYCFIDVRCEMGRYHTTNHLETLLRV